MRNKIIDKVFKNICFYYQNKIYIKKYDVSSSTNSRIYMFHNISNEKTNLLEFNSNVEGFEKFIINLLKNYKPGNMEDVIANPNMFAITFDDVNMNIYKYAIPILKKYSIPFTLFIAVDYLNKEGYISTKELENLKNDELCTIGVHTMSHTILRFEKDLEYEIKESKIVIERIIGKKAVYFAYPYGSIYACSRRNIKYVEKCGFERAFSAINGTITTNALKNQFFIPRINGDVCVDDLERSTL